MTPSLLWKSGAFLGASAVGLAAYGSHGLSKLLAKRGVDAAAIASSKANWLTAAQYQMFSALALLIISNTRFSQNKYAGPLILTGSLFFSGSIYGLILAKNKLRFLGPITPLGGLLMIVGWLVLAF